MAWTYEEVLAALGDEAQCVPGAIVVYRNKHITVGEVGLHGGFAVTPEGLKILDEVQPKPTKKSGKGGLKTPVAEPVAEPEDDLDLS